MSTSPSFLIQVQGVTCGPIQNLSFTWPTGVSWVCGDEGKGKTTLLRLLAHDVRPTTGQVRQPEGGVFWANLQGSAYDGTTVQTCWENLRTRYPEWDEALLHDLADALQMNEHRQKQLHMLSAGSRRKVMVVAALASGATLTLMDQPFAALDMVSIRIIQDFLREAAGHPSRAWIVADYEAPHDLPLASVLNLG